MDYDRIDEGKHEDHEKEGPFVKEIVLPTSLYDYALHRGYQTYDEVGFYLIGLFKKSVCYVYDLIEFEYSEQSGGFIESDLTRFFRLKTGIPLGLRIVGHLHKHPGFTNYSATDKQNFLRYGHSNPLNAFLIYMVEPYNKISGYNATAEKIFPVKVTIRELTSEEMLLEKDLKIEFKTKILLPQNSNYSDFMRVLSENISSETLKFLSRPTIQTEAEKSQITREADINIIPRKAVEIEDVGNNKSIVYRLFMEESETITDLEKCLKQLVNIPKEKGFEMVFYQEGQRLSRDTKIAAINRPVVWSFEKSMLYNLFKNFSNFWESFSKILKGQEKVKAPEALQPAEEKVQTELSSAELFEESKDVPKGQDLIEKAETSSEKEIMAQPAKESPPKVPEKVVEIEDIVKKSEAEAKKRKDFRRDRLDYFI